MSTQQPEALPEKYYLVGGVVKTWDEGQMCDFADRTHAIRASHGQAPAGASKFADVIAVQRGEAESDPSDAYMVGLYNGMSMMDANYRNLPDWEPMGTMPKPSPTAQAAESVPALEREQERIAFKDAHRHLELDEVPDAWGRPMFKHSHIEASWLGWIARAARAPADSVPAKSYAELEKKYSDFVETAGLMLEAVGYTEDYARQWPKEEASITFKRWFDEQLATRPTPPAMDVGEDAEQERPVQRMEGWTDTRYIAELENVVRLLRRDREKLHRVRDALSEKGGR